MKKNYKQYYILLVLFTILFNVGCTSTKGNAVKYPVWFNNVHSDSNLFYYATAEGVSKKQAINSALNEIASKVSVSIESSFESSTSVIKTNNSDEYINRINKNVKSKVKKIEFNSYEVIKSTQLTNNKFIVSIKLNRMKNAEYMSKKVDTSIKQYNQILNNNSLNIVSKLKNFIQISDEIKSKTLPDCFIMKSLFNDDGIDNKISLLLNIQSKIDKFKSSLSFGVNSKNFNEYNNIIEEVISSNQFSVVKSNFDINIKLIIKEAKVKSMGNYILKSKITITLLADNKIVGQEILTIGAKSRSNYAQAKEFALNDFKNKLVKNNILKNLLGI